MLSKPHPLPNAAAHFQVAEVAKAIAAEIYDRFAVASDAFYQQNPSQGAYVEKSWPLYCETARATLATLLTGNLSDVLKNQIHEALVLDNDLRPTRQHLQVDPT